MTVIAWVRLTLFLTFGILVIRPGGELLMRLTDNWHAVRIPMRAPARSRAASTHRPHAF